MWNIFSIGIYLKNKSFESYPLKLLINKFIAKDFELPGRPTSKIGKLLFIETINENIFYFNEKFKATDEFICILYI